MALDPEADVAAWLEGTVDFPNPPDGSLALDLGTNMFRGPPRESVNGTPYPTLCVFVQCVGGGVPQPYLDGADKSLFKANIQVIVRGNIEAYASGLALARGCLRLIHLAAIGSGAYVRCVAMVSEPQYDTWVELGGHQWRIPVEVWWIEAVAV